MESFSITVTPTHIELHIRRAVGHSSFFISSEQAAQIICGLRAYAVISADLLLGEEGGSHVRFFPPQEVNVTIATGHLRYRQLTIPTPPAVGLFLAGKLEGLFAVEQRPLTLDTPLYRFPSPNVGHDGKICWGNSKGGRSYQDFWATAFNDHLAQAKSKAMPDHILDFWEKIKIKRVNQSKRPPYPLDDLVPAGAELSYLVKLMESDNYA